MKKSKSRRSSSRSGISPAQLKLVQKLDLHFALLTGEPVELGAAIVLGSADFEIDPTALDQAVESRIKRPLLNLEHVVRPTLDGFRDRMAVSRPKTKRAENQQIERTLQELKTARIVTSRHTR